MVPSYIDLILQLVGETSRYDLRNRSDFTVLPQRTTIFQNSCIPLSVRAWNSLDDQYRNCQTYRSFCYKIKNDLNSSVKFQIIIIKETVNLPHYTVDYVKDAVICMLTCFIIILETMHYVIVNKILKMQNIRCNRYEHERVHMFHKIRQFLPLSVSDALNGKKQLVCRRQFSSVWSHTNIY